ncbi:MAG: DUF4214 domain-containing protein [Clostridiales bacterium]|nr:DUF4214 domain-containing protein [Clostridiales bacterium]
MFRRLTSFMIMLFVCISVMCPGLPVLADQWTQAVDYNDTHYFDLDPHESVMVKYTARQTGTYRFFPYRGQQSYEMGDPDITLYDSNHNLIGYSDHDPYAPEGDDCYIADYHDQFGIYKNDNGAHYNYNGFYLEHELVRNQTYYIKLEAGSLGGEFSFIIDRGIWVTADIDGASCSGDCMVDSSIQHTYIFDIYNYGTIMLEAENRFMHGDDYTYTWYDSDNDPYRTTPIPAYGNCLYLTAHAGTYTCVVEKGNYEFILKFVLRMNEDADHEFSDIEYFLLTDGAPFEYTPTATVNGEHRVIDWQTGFAVEEDDDSYEHPKAFSDGDTLSIPSGIHGFAAYNYIVESDDTVITRPLTLFHLGNELDGQIRNGDSLDIDIDNEVDNYYFNLRRSTCQMIYSYTPEESGTVTFTVTPHDSGVPTAVIFDQNRNYLGQAGGDQYFTESGFRYIWPDDHFELDLEETRSFSTHVEAGQTYYVAIPVVYLGCSGVVFYRDMFCPDFNLSAGFRNDPPAGSSDQQGSGSSTSGGASSGASSEASSQPSGSSSPAPVTADATEPPYTAPISGTPVSASQLSVADFVERLYTVALGRTSDPVGKQDWIDAVTLRGQTGADLARGFLYSPEFLGKNVSNEEFVRVLYRTFFDREADADGLNGWVSVLDNGGSKEHVIEGFINSTEWANLCLLYGIRCGGTGVPSIVLEPNQSTIDFATRLYTTCLSRSADQDGLMAWARQLANQRDTGTGAARGFFFSSEFTGQNVSNGEYVSRLYRTFMEREPDEAGYSAWVSQLDGGVSREEVFNGFAGSSEFARICANYGILR